MAPIFSRTFDRRSDDKTNANVLILGNSGQGKSHLLKGILANLREVWEVSPGVRPRS